MIAMNTLLIDLIQCQQRMQNDTFHALQVIHKSQQDHTNDSLIDDITTLMENLSNFLLESEARKHSCCDQMES